MHISISKTCFDSKSHHMPIQSRPREKHDSKIHECGHIAPQQYKTSDAAEPADSMVPPSFSVNS